MSGLGEPTFSLNHKRVYIAGINGMVGSAIARNLRLRKDLEVFGLNSTELDLLDRRETQKVLAGLDIDVLIMAAAKVGGIESNRKFPVEFINNNLEIQLNLLQSAHECRIERVLFLGSSCIYPRDSEQPIREEYLLTGQLEDTNRAYAIAKIAGIEQIQAYRREYGHKWISAMPCNLYGRGDYFNNERAHVIPGLLNRFEDANLSQNDVGAAYNYGNYSSGGITRDVQVFETDYELGGTFTPISCGYHTNSLDRYEIYNFADMEEMGGLPGYLDYLWDILDYSKDFGDKISKKEINLINNKNFLFYYNGAFQDKFNNIYLRQLAGISKSTTDNKSSQDSINVNTSEIPENKDTQDIINSQPIEMTDSVKK